MLRSDKYIWPRQAKQLNADIFKEKSLILLNKLQIISSDRVANGFGMFLLL